MATNSENTPARRVDDKRPAGHLDWNNPEQPAATAFAYEIKPRAADVGGGWALALLENGSEVGGGVFPVTEKTSADDAHLDAMEQGEEWLASRQVPPLIAPAPLTDELPTTKMSGQALHKVYIDSAYGVDASMQAVANAALRHAVENGYLQVPGTAPAPQQSELSDYVLMPKRLTAENGAKGALSGEFKENVTVTCHECGGSGDDAGSDNDAECPECKGDGTLDQAVPVTWDTIKDIYARAVELLAKAAPAAPVQATDSMIDELWREATTGNRGDTTQDFVRWFARELLSTAVSGASRLASSQPKR
jgi:hypothetical protein